MSKCICDEMGWVEDCPRHSGAQPSRGAPTPVRQGAAFTAKEFDAELWTERDPQNKLAFAEAFSAHQNAELRKERDALTVALESLLKSAEHAVCIGEDCFRCFVGKTAEAALESTKD